jgi:hypothetical protein
MCVQLSLSKCKISHYISVISTILLSTYFFVMTQLSKLVDSSTLEGVESLLLYAKKDDIAFLTLIILTGIFYNFYFKEKPDPYHHVWFEKPQAIDANAKGAATRDIGLKLEESVSSINLLNFLTRMLTFELE